MNILWFSWRDIKNPQAGGAEKVAFEISKRLVRDNNEVTIFTSKFDGAKESENVSGVKIIRSGNRLTCRLHSFFHFLKKRKQLDIIVDEINTIPFFTPLFTKKSICFIHQLAREYWFSNTPWPFSTFGYLLEPIYLKLYAKMLTITVSKSTKSDLQKLGFDNIHIIREGLDPALSKVIATNNSLSLRSQAFTLNYYEGKRGRSNLFPTKQSFLLFIGRLIPAKKPQDAILAFAKISAAIPNSKLVIIGRGEKNYVKRLKNLAKGLKLSRQIEFAGYVDQKTKINLLKKSKIVLIPAIREGWGLVATEAMALGCVPIAYNVSGLKDAIRNYQTGILTDPNPQALANVSIKLLKDKKLRSKLAQNGFNLAQKFSWDNTYNDFKKVLGDKFSKVPH